MMPRRLTLDPVAAPAARPVRGPPRRQRTAQRLVVHPRQHQHLAGVVLLHDRGDEPGRIAREPGENLRGAGTSHGYSSQMPDCSALAGPVLTRPSLGIAILGGVPPATRGYRDSRVVAASGRAQTSHAAAVGPSSPTRVRGAGSASVPAAVRSAYLRAGPLGSRRCAHTIAVRSGHRPAATPRPPDDM